MNEGRIRGVCEVSSIRRDIHGNIVETSYETNAVTYRIGPNGEKFDIRKEEA